MIGILYSLLYLLVLFVPGWLIVRLIGIRTGRLVFILASSYIYFALLAILSKSLGLSLIVWFMIYIGLLIPVTVAALRMPVPAQRAENSIPWLLGLCLVLGSYSLYYLLAGAYTEVPADFLHHLNYTRQQLAGIEEGQLGPERSLIALLKQKGGIWYSLYGGLSTLCGLDIDQTLAWTSLLNALLFLSAVYAFSGYIVGHYRLSARQGLAAVILTTFFTTVHLGLNIFAYIRYYALAPTMLNMVIYFAAIIAALELLKWQQARIRYAVFLLLALCTTVTIHNQEALFILITASMMLGWFALYPRTRDTSPVKLMLTHSQRVYRVLLFLLACAFLGMVTWAYLTLQRPELLHNKIIQLSEQGPILNRLLFLNPAFQAIEVITLWGLLVYALFLVYWRRFIGHPYLFAGMLIPVFTVFNPLFVDWFMRMDGVHTLWRVLYIVPIHLVGGLSCVFLLDSALNHSQALKRVTAWLGVALLFLTLLPLYGLNSNSRLTLAPVDHDDSYLYWQDLMDHLDEHYPKRTSILTDPVTGYMIAGLTHHRTYHRKFQNSGLKPINFKDYSTEPFKKYSGWLLVINDRDGGHSQAGETARHWPADILQTSRFYSAALREHIRTNPANRFENIWEKDGIRIYSIK